jgi:hypothetical protein
MPISPPVAGTSTASILKGEMMLLLTDIFISPSTGKEGNYVAIKLS